MTSHALLHRWTTHHDPEAFRELVSRHAPMVFATSKRILGNEIEAEDVAQECFELLAAGRHQQTGQFGAWLHRIAVNRSIDRLRASRQRMDREQRFVKNQDKRTAERWDDIYQYVDAAIGELPTKYREAVVAHYLEGRTHEAIARELGVSRQAVTDRIHRGVEGIRKHLKRRGIEASAVLLATMLSQHAQAKLAPASLTATLGKLALAGPVSGSAGTTAVETAFGLKLLLPAVLFVAGAAAIVAIANTEIESTEEAAANMEHDDSQDVAARDRNATSDATFMASSSTSPAVPSTERSAQEFEVTPGTDTHLGSISGRVVLPDGRPFADAQVYAQRVEDDGLTTAAITGAAMDGTFTIAELTAGEYSLQVTPRGSSTSGRTFEVDRKVLSRGEHLTGIELVYGGEGELSIAGTVVDTSGNPIEGIDILTKGNVTRIATTDSRGAFVLEYLPEGHYGLMASAVGQSRYTTGFAAADAGDNDVQIVLLGKGAIEGVVVRANDFEPVSEFEVSYINGHRTESLEHYFGNSQRVLDDRGRFKFENVYVDDVTIFARAEGYAPGFVHTRIRENETARGLVIELRPGITIRGHVVDTAGLPISGASIVVGGVQPPDMRRHSSVIAETDSRGEFVVEEFPPGTTVLSAYRDGFAPAASLVSEELEFVLQKPLSLVANVLSAGVPQYNAEVRVYFSAESRAEYLGGGITDQEGRVVTDAVLPGPALITAELNDDRRLEKRVRLEPGKTHEVNFDFAPPAASLEGVVTHRGQPLQNAYIIMLLETEFGVERHTAVTKADGSYVFRGIPEGRGAVRADTSFVDDSTPNEESDTVELILESGGAFRADLEVGGDAGVQGRFIGYDGGAYGTVIALDGRLSESEVAERLLPRDDNFYQSGFGRCDDAGVYSVDSLRPGEYTLVAHSRPLNDYNSPQLLGIAHVQLSETQFAEVDFRFR